MKTSTLFTLLSAAAALWLSSGCDKPKETPNPPSQPVQAQPAPAAQAQPPALPAQSTGPLTQFTARSGSKMRIDGKANMIHPQWRVQSELIQGHLDVGPAFPTEPGQAASAGPVAAAADVSIPVSSLKSIEEDGKPFSDAMDNIMYEKLKPDAQPKIYFHLKQLVLKEPAKTKEAPYLFESTGELAVAGVTNAITMPVQVLPMGNQKLKISGAVAVKMTSFKMTPPVALAGALKTEDEVKLSFEWFVAPKGMPTSAAAK